MNISEITPQKTQISQLFDPEGNTRYEVPKYQRQYTWARKEWAQLYDDLIENAEGYFLGSIISIARTKADNSIHYEVIDGQQRLTTISLLILALYSVLSAHQDTMSAPQKAKVLLLPGRLVCNGSGAGIRLRPQAEKNNLQDYLSLLSEEKVLEEKHQKPHNAGNRKIYLSYNYFKDRLEKDLTGVEDKVKFLFDFLAKVNTAILVHIIVYSSADAYRLFESLNNRGVPLSVMDLIKNLLLAKLDDNNPETLTYYYERWKSAVDHLGEDGASQERFLRHNYNAFRYELNQPFVREDGKPYPLGPFATRSSVLEMYEQLVSKDPKQFLDGFSANAGVYAKITLQATADGLSPTLKKSYLDLQRVQGVPSYLLLLYLEKNRGLLNLDDNLLARVANLLVRFFVRRNVTDLPPTRELDRMFTNIVEVIRQKKLSGEGVYNSVLTSLQERSPDDASFLEKLKGPIYDENSTVTRFILCSIAESGMNKEQFFDLWVYDSKIQKPTYVWTIEHIFPQGDRIPKCWVEMVADGDMGKAADIQEQFVHKLGNLTITGYNSNLGNASFEEKKDRLHEGKHIGYLNGLNLNDDVKDKKVWTEKEIADRTDRLAKVALETFALACQKELKS